MIGKRRARWALIKRKKRARKREKGKMRRTLRRSVGVSFGLAWRLRRAKTAIPKKLQMGPAAATS